MINFTDCALFVENDLTGNFTKLLAAAGLDSENDVDRYISAFSASGTEWQVGDSKRKSALFVLYLRHLLAKNRVEYESGKALEMTGGARSLTQQFFGEAVMHHSVPMALMTEGATISTTRAA